jgi:succinate-semialdehyde dehydrogenase/glutarate-semialdehyde dehydrogenase
MTDVNLKEGFYFHPMVLDNLTKDQPAYCEELFGPVFSVFKFKDSLEAVDLANSSVYGLNASIFSSDIKQAEQLARMLDVGSVFINDMVSTDPALPSGGVKDSGYGRELYKDGIIESANRKTIVIAKI